MERNGGRDSRIAHIIQALDGDGFRGLDELLTAIDPVVEMFVCWSEWVRECAHAQG